MKLNRKLFNLQENDIVKIVTCNNEDKELIDKEVLATPVGTYLILLVTITEDSAWNLPFRIKNVKVKISRHLVFDGSINNSLLNPIDYDHSHKCIGLLAVKLLRV